MEKPIINLDGIDYFLEDMTIEQQNFVKHLQDLDIKINNTIFALQQLDVCKSTFTRLLSDSLTNTCSEGVITK